MNSTSYSWTLNKMIVPTAWQKGEWAYDWAMANMTLTKTFPGWTGTQWNQNPNAGEAYTALGYPGGGTTMYYDVSSYVRRLQPNESKTYNMTGMMMASDNTLTPGASGGPWWRGSLPPLPQVNGLNSQCGQGASLGDWYSPYFDDTFKSGLQYFGIV